MKEEYKPDLALPFVIDRKEAIEIIRKNFAKKMFIPKDFCSTSSLESLQGRYVPFWMYDMETHVHFEGEGRKIRTWTEGDSLKEEDLQFLAESAHADACAPGNPKDASVEDLKALFRKLM